MLFIEYPKCSTCKKAKKWLDDNKIEYTDRHIAEIKPTYDLSQQYLNFFKPMFSKTNFS